MAVNTGLERSTLCTLWNACVHALGHWFSFQCIALLGIGVIRLCICGGSGFRLDFTEEAPYWCTSLSNLAFGRREKNIWGTTFASVGGKKPDRGGKFQLAGERHKVTLRH